MGPDHPRVATSSNNLAGLYGAQGQLGKALNASARAVGIIEKHLALRLGRPSGARSAAPRQHQAYFITYIGDAHVIAEYASGEQRASTAAKTFRSVQLARRSATGEALAGMAARFAAGADTLGAIVRDHQDLAARCRFLDESIVKAMSRRPTERNTEEETTLRVALGAVRSVVGIEGGVVSR